MAAILAAGVANPVAAAERIALIIGNSAYSKQAEIPNAVKDAQLIADTLKLPMLGFGIENVHLHTDLDLAGVSAAIKAKPSPARSTPTRTKVEHS